MIMKPHRARNLRKSQTDAEQRLWAAVRNRQIAGMKFRRQVAIGPHIADFVSFEVRLIVEVDGGQHADSTADAKRTAYLEAHGFRVIRFWNNEVLQNLEGVLQSIAMQAES
jgi:adenine-specific DNA-methyltransferase